MITLHPIIYGTFQGLTVRAEFKKPNGTSSMVIIVNNKRLRHEFFSGFLDASCDVGWPGGQSALNKGPQVHQH